DSRSTGAPCAGILATFLLAGDRAPDEEHDDRAGEGQHPGPDGEEVPEALVEEDRADPPADDGSDHAEQQGLEPAARPAPRQHLLADRAHDEPQNDPAEKAHGDLLARAPPVRRSPVSQTPL